MSLHSLEQAAIQQVITQAQPVAGAAYAAITVPVGVRWRLETLSYVHTTSANAATRVARMLLADSAGNVFARPGANAIFSTVSSSLTVTYGRNANPLNGVVGGGLMNVFWLPDIWLPPGAVITLQTSQEAADQLSALAGWVTVATDAS